jgi:hypothetical protein
MVLSIRALSYAVPTRPTEPARPRSSSFSVNASDVYCEPASLNGRSRRRRRTIAWTLADVHGLQQRARDELGALLERTVKPRMRREKASCRNDTYIQPSRVRTCVKSHTHTRSGASRNHARRTRSGERTSGSDGGAVARASGADAPQPASAHQARHLVAADGLALALERVPHLADAVHAEVVAVHGPSRSSRRSSERLLAQRGRFLKA